MISYIPPQGFKRLRSFVKFFGFFCRNELSLTFFYSKCTQLKLFSCLLTCVQRRDFVSSTENAPQVDEASSRPTDEGSCCHPQSSSLGDPQSTGMSRCYQKDLKPLKSQVQPSPGGPVFITGWETPHRLAINSYWVLRLPYVYWGEGG